ncbi:MAG: thioesterase domain-containing protein, partial [Aquabacterium sp.]|nr:thioesterase domain-containing protein [Aquabacterium sp.]
PPSSFVEPQGPIEQRLATLWQQTLGVTRVGRHDSFFDLGGHSLLAIRLVQACVRAAREELGFADAEDILPLAHLLATPTLAAMAQRLQSDALQAAAAAPHARLLVPLRAGGSRPPLFCVHPQSGWALCFSALTQALPTDQPVWALQARGLMPGEAPHDSMASMVADYLQAVRSVQPTGPYHLLGYSSGGIAAQAMASALAEAGEQVALLALLDSPLPASIDAQSVDEKTLLQAAAAHFGLSAAGAKGTPAPPPTPAELASDLQHGALAGQPFTEADGMRLIRTARAIGLLSRNHQPRLCAAPLLQLRALRRTSVLDDWSALTMPGRTTTHDLDVDHDGLISTTLAPALASLLLHHLGTSESPLQP